MKSSTQKILLEKLLSSPEVFSRCIPIVEPDYFNKEFRAAVRFIKTYYEEYKAVPKLDYINAEYDTDFKTTKLDTAEIKFSCDAIESHCKQIGLYNAIVASSAEVTSNADPEVYGKIHERIQKALAISIQKELGIEMFSNIEKRLETYMNSATYEPTGIVALDDALGGGLARKQVTMFSANSGGGKSLMMSNIAANYARRGFNVLQLALELTDEMIDLRNISILTGVKASEWKLNVAEITAMIKRHREAGAGSFVVKRIPGGSSALDMRSYLRLYETEYGFKPDVLVVDYLDLMSPNGGTRGKGVYEQDKEKSEELAELAFDYDCITITASQQNREAIRNANPDQAVIAGGISKVNTVDNYISIYMNPEMRLKGEMLLYFLKTRSSSAVGTMVQLAFNPDNLIISDKKITVVSVIEGIKRRAKNKWKAGEDKLIFPGQEADTTLALPEEFADVIEEYHRMDDIVRNQYDNRDTPLDIEDDDSLWDKKGPRITISSSDDGDYANYVTF